MKQSHFYKAAFIGIASLFLATRAAADPYLEKCKFVNGAIQMPSWNNTVPIVNAGDVSTSAVPRMQGNQTLGVVINGTANTYSRPTNTTCASSLPSGSIGDGSGFMLNETFRWLGSYGPNAQPITAICIGSDTAGAKIYIGYCEL